MSQVTRPALFLDEDVPLVVARLRHMHGFMAITTRDANRLGSSDEEQLTVAATQGYAILTHNRKDFLLLHRA